MESLLQQRDGGCKHERRGARRGNRAGDTELPLAYDNARYGFRLPDVTHTLPAGWRIQAQRRIRRSAVATNGKAKPSKTCRIGVISWRYGSNECPSPRPFFRNGCLAGRLSLFPLICRLLHRNRRPVRFKPDGEGVGLVNRPLTATQCPARPCLGVHSGKILNICAPPANIDPDGMALQNTNEVVYCNS